MAAKQEKRKLAERQDLERRRREGFERSLRKKLLVGDLLTMHKEGRSYSVKTILQVVEQIKDESVNLHSIALSYGEHVSHNIKTLPSSPFCYHYIFSVEYVAKVITISRINSQKKLQFKPLHKNYIVSKTRRQVALAYTANICNFNVYYTQFDLHR